MERERYCELIWCLWIGLIFRNNVHLQPWVDWKIFTTQLAGTEFSRRCQRGRWRGDRWFKIIFHTKCTSGVLINRCSNLTWFISWTLIQNHFPHKMHRSRRVGSTCRSFKQEPSSKVWFWFAKLILKRSGSFLGKVFHYYTHFFYRFDRNVIKPRGRAWFRCSVRGCSAK